MPENVEVEMPQDFKANIQWIMKEYSDNNATLPDAFQKDAIQNSVGAKKSKSSWDGWQCRIDFVENTCGKFLIVEDRGSWGLTGPNLNSRELKEKIDDGTLKAKTEWRLARFSSRNVSGGNVGPGLFGVGKSLYSAASEDYKYFFDSKTDSTYVANKNDCGIRFDVAYEGEKAEQFIHDETGLGPKETNGTRIIICNPRQEILDSFESGEFIAKIQETWWPCLKQLEDLSNAGIFVNGTKVHFPAEMFAKENNAFSQEYTRPIQADPDHRIKHFGFFISKKENDRPWQDIYFYRKGMRIGKISLSGFAVPSRFGKRWWGYIEVDGNWESDLEEIENGTHYGFDANLRYRRVAFKLLREKMSQQVKALLVEWGCIKENTSDDERIHNMMQQISEQVQDLFQHMEFPEIGKGQKKPDFVIRLKDVSYPNIYNREVLTGDEISCGFRITSNYSVDKKFEYKISVIPFETGDGHVLEVNTVTISPGETLDIPYKIVISEDIAQRYERNQIVITVRNAQGTKEKSRRLDFFYDTADIQTSRDTIALALKGPKFPRENSTRVDSGETLTGISYIVNNKKPYPIDFAIKVRVHDFKSKQPIVKIGQFDGHADAMNETEVPIPDITIDAATYEPVLLKGILELRADMICTSTDNPEFMRGEIVTQYYFKFNFNQDDKKGAYGAFEALGAHCKGTENEKKRSYLDVSSTPNKIFINIDHPAYIRLSTDEDRQEEYIRQEIMKQYVMMYLYSNAGNEMFHIDEENDNPYEIATKVLDEMEEVYFNSVNGE